MQFQLLILCSSALGEVGSFCVGHQGSINRAVIARADQTTLTWITQLLTGTHFLRLCDKCPSTFGLSQLFGLFVFYILVFCTDWACLAAKGDSRLASRWQVGVTAMVQPELACEYGAGWKICGRGIEQPEFELDAREIYPVGVGIKNGAV